MTNYLFAESYSPVFFTFLYDIGNFQGVTNQKVAASFSSAWSEGDSIVKVQND